MGICIKAVNNKAVDNFRLDCKHVNRDKLISSAGENNPSVQFAQSKINDLRVNISRSLKSYHEQLKLSQSQIKERNKKFTGQVAQLPQKMG